MKSSSRVNSRRLRAEETFGTAQEALGTIEHGEHVFLITRGQFSMLDMIEVVIRQIGECNISVWTWAIADYEVQAMDALALNRKLLSARLIVDRSAERRSVETIDMWRERFGSDSVRVCKNHAKIARIWNAEWSILIRGSMNLNFNPRFEQADITEGGEDFTLVQKIETELPVLKRLCGNPEAVASSKLKLAFMNDDIPKWDDYEDTIPKW